MNAPVTHARTAQLTTERKAMKHNAIETAIRELKADRARIDTQLKLLSQALRPQSVKPVPEGIRGTDPTKPKPAAKPRKPAPEKLKTNDVEHMQVLSIMDGAMKLADIAEKAGHPVKKTRSLLSDLVEDGKVIQSGSRRGLRFLKRGAEFDKEHEA